MSRSYEDLIKIEDIKAEIHERLSSIPMSARDYSKIYELDYARSRRYFKNLLQRGLIKIAFTNNHSVGGVKVPYYKAWNEFKRIDYSERHKKLLAKKNSLPKSPKKEPSLIKEGHIITDPNNPNKKTYLNMSRPGSDYNWQRRRSVESRGIGSSFSIMEDL